MYFSVDIIEETVALCIDDDGATHAIALDLIDGEVSEGAVLVENENGRYSLDKDEEERRRESNFKLAESLFDE